MSSKLSAPNSNVISGIERLCHVNAERVVKNNVAASIPAASALSELGRPAQDPLPSTSLMPVEVLTIQPYVIFP